MMTKLVNFIESKKLQREKTAIAINHVAKLETMCAKNKHTIDKLC